jgi:hypothetical protein
MLDLRQPASMRNAVLTADFGGVRTRTAANDADAAAAFASLTQVDFYPWQVVPVGFE